jgi:hypothetical protein
MMRKVFCKLVQHRDLCEQDMRKRHRSDLWSSGSLPGIRKRDLEPLSKSERVLGWLKSDSQRL